MYFGSGTRKKLFSLERSTTPVASQYREPPPPPLPINENEGSASAGYDVISLRAELADTKALLSEYKGYVEDVLVTEVEELRRCRDELYERNCLLEGDNRLLADEVGRLTSELAATQKAAAPCVPLSDTSPPLPSNAAAVESGDAGRSSRLGTSPTSDRPESEFFANPGAVTGSAGDAVEADLRQQVEQLSRELAVYRAMVAPASQAQEQQQTQQPNTAVFAVPDSNAPQTDTIMIGTTSSSPSVSTANNAGSPSPLPGTTTLLSDICADGARFCAALCQLLNSRDHPDEELSAVSQRWARLSESASTTTAVVPEEVLLLSRDEHARVAAAFRHLHEHCEASRERESKLQKALADLRDSTEKRFEEIEEEHQAEVDSLQLTIRELDMKVAVVTSARAMWTAGVPQLTNDAVDGFAGPIDNPPNGSFFSATGGAAGGGMGSQSSTQDVPGGNGSFGRAAPVPGVEATTQTPLSMEYIQGALRAARDDILRSARKDKEAEIIDLMCEEIEKLRDQLWRCRSYTNLLEEQRRRFLGNVDTPLTDLERAILADRPFISH